MPLPSWCISLDGINTVDDILECFSHYKEIPIIVGNQGWFLKGNSEWYEVELEGKLRAFEDLKPGMFKYELSILNHQPLNDSDVKLLSSIKCGSPQLQKGIFELLEKDKEWKSLRDIRRNGLKMRMRFDDFKTTVLSGIVK